MPMSFSSKRQQFKLCLSEKMKDISNPMVEGPFGVLLRKGHYEDFFLLPVLFSNSNLLDKTLGIISIKLKRKGKALTASLFILNVRL